MGSAKMSPSRRRALDFVTRFTAENGRPPSLSEVAHGCGFESKNTADHHLKALVRDGHLGSVSLSDGRRVAVAKGVPRLRVKDFGDVACGPKGPLDEDVSWQWRDLAEGLDEDIYSLTARGRSMEGIGIMNGDVLLFRAISGEWPNRKVVVVAIDGEVTCKELRKVGGEWWLYPYRKSDDGKKSTSKEPPPAPVRLDPTNEKVVVQGVLVRVWRNIEA